MQTNIKEAHALKRRIHMPAAVTILVFLFLSLTIMGLTVMIQPYSIFENIKIFLRQPILILLNTLPVSVLLLILWFISKSLLLSSAITSAVFGVLALVNRYKITFRDDPFVPKDIALIREAFNSIERFELELDVTPIILLAAVVIILIIAAVFIKSWAPKSIIARLAGIIVAAAVMVASFFTLYTDVALYDSLQVSARYNITAVYNELGFNYNFIRHMNLYPVEKPDDYNEAEVQSWIEAGESGGKVTPQVSPNLIFIMCEAYTDLSTAPAFDYNNDNDPLKNFKRLAAEEGTVSGHLIAPNFGAGTANMEFEVLTGMQTNLIAPSTLNSSAFRVVRKNMYSVPRLLADEGDYANVFMHPGESWFYNRSSVYQFLGIDKQLFIDEFNEDYTSGSYDSAVTSDDFFADELCKVFEEQDNASSNPQYFYTVTIENHQPYTPIARYGTETTQLEPFTVDIEDELANNISTYIQGVRAGDEMLGKLTDTFNSVNEPTVIVFFGDHRPTFGGDYNGYRQLGMSVGNTDTPEEILGTYEVPFMIWGNSAAKNAGLPLHETADLPESKQISANYLGAMALELTGYSGQDAFIDFINEMRRELPVAWKEVYLTADGTATTELTDEQKALVRKLRNWEYYKLEKETVN